ncbi:TetR-like C-terminal domain-containing protein [Streptomyces sp. 3N207]|uniref:TetR-like C-terminal domain-containing protein n=1 Tax=Streptomyces sp. 3N207 TaxID=3457417 RepID=UPI003FCF389E
MEKLSARAGVHATTIRRRWGSVQGVVMDLFEYVAQDIAVPDTGSLEEDLRLLAEGVLTLYTSTRNRNLLTRMVAAVGEHPDSTQVMRDFFAARTRQVAGIVERAIARGEVPGRTNPLEVIEAVSAPVYYRLLVTQQPVDPSLAHRLAEVASRAARAGAFN